MLFHFFVVFDEQESGHSRDVVFHGRVLSLVHIDFEKNHGVLELSLHFFNLGCDHFAGATPGGEKIHDHQLVSSRGHLGFEVREVIALINHRGAEKIHNLRCDQGQCNEKQVDKVRNWEILHHLLFSTLKLINVFSGQIAKGTLLTLAALHSYSELSMHSGLFYCKIRAS